MIKTLIFALMETLIEVESDIFWFWHLTFAADLHLYMYIPMIAYAEYLIIAYARVPDDCLCMELKLYSFNKFWFSKCSLFELSCTYIQVLFDEKITYIYPQFVEVCFILSCWNHQLSSAP